MAKTPTPLAETAPWGHRPGVSACFGAGRSEGAGSGQRGSRGRCGRLEEGAVGVIGGLGGALSVGGEVLAGSEGRFGGWRSRVSGDLGVWGVWGVCEGVRSVGLGRVSGTLGPTWGTFPEVCSRASPLGEGSPGPTEGLGGPHGGPFQGPGACRGAMEPRLEASRGPRTRSLWDTSPRPGTTYGGARSRSVPAIAHSWPVGVQGVPQAGGASWAPALP